jgi:transposase
MDTLGRRVSPRRHRSIEEKRAIVAEALRPGASVAEIARRHAVNANLVFMWKRLHEQGLLETHTRRMRGRRLVPVKLLAESRGATASPAALRVDLPGGAQLHIGNGTDLALVARVLELLR